VKINGVMASLHGKLQTGDRVEVLTGKDERPSRDWLNPHLNYLKTSRAKAKVLHWFKMQDYDMHRSDGQAMVEKELKALGIKFEAVHETFEALNYKSIDDLYAAIGRGEVKLTQILHRLTQSHSTEPFLPVAIKVVKHERAPTDLRIEGVGQLLTSMARCCQPVPGDEVVGYITLGKGVSIHRQDCPNILHATEKQRQRFLQVSWGEGSGEKYLVDLQICAYDRVDLLKDVTSVLSIEKTHIYRLQGG
jgi:GTP pyrophosphokinase